MKNRDIEGQLREHTGLVESLAERLSRRSRDERDDLVQEGLIAVWEALRSGKPVTEDNIVKRMQKWLRYRGRQKRDVPTSYDKLLPMEDLRAVNAATISTRPPEGAGPDAAE
jgi:DNA-directed RNA polymerase specialized sigma24 family protein